MYEQNMAASTESEQHQMDTKPTKFRTNKYTLSNPTSLQGENVLKEKPNLFYLYPESVAIGIDTLGTYCMTNIIGDFIDIPVDCKHTVLGVNNIVTNILNTCSGICIGQDEQGLSHQWIIPEL
jgi:hypothetical protein